MIDIKWLIFIVWCFISIIVLLFKLNFDLNRDLKLVEKVSTPKFRVIRYEPSIETFLIDKSSLLGHNALVSIYYLKKEFEIELGRAYVSNIQENFIQLKIEYYSEKFEKNHVEVLKRIQDNDTYELNNIIIKTYVTK